MNHQEFKTKLGEIFLDDYNHGHLSSIEPQHSNSLVLREMFDDWIAFAQNRFYNDRLETITNQNLLDCFNDWKESVSTPLHNTNSSTPETILDNVSTKWISKSDINKKSQKLITSFWKKRTAIELKNITEQSVTKKDIWSILSGFSASCNTSLRNLGAINTDIAKTIMGIASDKKQKVDILTNYIREFITPSYDRQYEVLEDYYEPSYDAQYEVLEDYYEPSYDAQYGALEDYYEPTQNDANNRNNTSSAMPNPRRTSSLPNNPPGAIAATHNRRGVSNFQSIPQTTATSVTAQYNTQRYPIRSSSYNNPATQPINATGGRRQASPNPRPQSNSSRP